MKSITHHFASFLSRALAHSTGRAARRRRQRPDLSAEMLEARLLLTVNLLSVTPSGTSGGLTSDSPVISRNGRFVAFHSDSEDLVITGATDGNGRQDVFVRDLELGTTTLISVTPAGRGGSGDSWLPSISDDGRFVAFSSFFDRSAFDSHNVPVRRECVRA
jgi:hypothetical protein